jgi:uncharacterized protein YkwD
MRTLLLLGLVLSGATIGVSATVGTGIQAIDQPVSDVLDEGDVPEQSSDGDSTPVETNSEGEPKLDGQSWGGSTPSPTRYAANQPTETPVDRSAERIEVLVHQEINERRQQHGLDTLSYDEELEDVADYHSEDMAENGYFAHESPGGETLGDRYDRFGYDCRVSTGGNSYATGAENIAYTYWETNLEGGVYHDSNRDVAEGLVNQWMNSTGHRENILRDYWENEGIGVSITTDSKGRTRIYATQNFC